MGRLASGLMLAVTAVWAVLIAASVVQDLAGLDAQARVWMLDVDAERSVYTWFSQLLLAAAAALLFMTGLDLFGKRRWLAIQWLLLAAVFLFLSMEESLGLHGKLSEKMDESGEFSGHFHFAWVIPAMAVVGAGLLAAIPFLRSLPARTAVLFLVSGAVFVSGAIGLEMVGAKAAFEHGDVGSPGYRAAANIEEALEGLGVILFLYAILDYRRRPEFGREAGLVQA